VNSRGSFVSFLVTVGACTALLMTKRLLGCCTLAAEELLLRCMMVDCMIKD
jgi:hypothetical protein